MPQAEPHIQRTSILEILTKRHDFVAASKRGDKGVAYSVIVQRRNRGDDKPARYGITASKKIGNAVIRNRAKRRLRALANSVLPHLGRNGWDYVLIGRAQTTINQPFDTLLENLRFAIKKLHQGETR